MSSSRRPTGWDVLEELYASDGGSEALEEAAGRLEELAEDCGPAE